MNYKRKTIMPKLKDIPEELTNQELLTELERRIDQGSIKIEFDTNQIKPQTNETSPTKILGLNKNTLLLGMVLIMGVLVFYSQSQKSTLPVGIQTTVKINEK